MSDELKDGQEMNPNIVPVPAPGSDSRGPQPMPEKSRAAQRVTIHLPVRKGPIVDIVFLIDSSQSMAPCFEAVKDSVKAFIGVLTGSAYAQRLIKEWRAKVVGYRDFRTDPEPLIDNPFTDDPAVLESQLDALKAEGGEEEPESLLEGIYHVSEMGQTDKGEPLSPDKWRARNTGARTIVVFTDATFHEEMEEPKGGTIDDVRNSVQANKIILQVLAPEMDCHYELSQIDKACYYSYEYDETRDDGAAKGLEELLSDPNLIAQNFYGLFDRGLECEVEEL